MLPKEKRIRRGAEIKKILSQKQFHFTSPLLYFAGQDNKNAERVLVICSKRLGNAVTRNRVRRQIVGGILRNKHKIAKNIDMIITPRALATGVDYMAQLEQGMKRIEIWKE